MDKIFHVFVSSTYTDLINERKKVSEAVAKAGYVAEGMEIFPASSQHQMDFIKRVIDRCDYYVLILAGRYGSVAEDGLSYTEKEYHYANSKGIPILAFIRGELGELPFKHTEQVEESRAKLDSLIDTLKKNSLVEFWSNPDELSAKALAALSQASVTCNPVGWIRADRAANEEVLSDVNFLRKENDSLKAELSKRKPSTMFDGLELAGMDETFEFHSSTVINGSRRDKTISLTWREILRNIGLEYRALSNTTGIETGLRAVLLEKHNITYSTTLSVDLGDKKRILIQMEALGLMEAKTVGNTVFHKLTEKGLALTLREIVVQSSQ